MSDPKKRLEVAREQGGTLCSSWEEVTRVLDGFELPEHGHDEDGEPTEAGWMFRGLKDASYRLAPAIEREAHACGRSWDELELEFLDEFRARARMHIDPRDLPEDRDILSWLALMQHYGVPTRLLDFTYSPYLGLYFALRDPTPAERTASAAVWAIHLETLHKAATEISAHCDEEERKARPKSADATPRRPVNPFDSDFHLTDADTYRSARDSERRMVTAALRPDVWRRASFNKHGFVARARPPIKNRRLSSQQGVFLFNGATEFDLEASLAKLMAAHTSDWFKLVTIPSDARAGCERRLFQMNIHELSLFPDTEGLVRFIRQKARLHWSAK